MKINEILRKIRMDHSYTQEHLAAEIGVDISTYGRYESGQVDMKLSHFLKLIKIYGLSPFKFIENYIINDSFELIEDPNVNYGKKVTEAQVKINDLSNTITSLKKDIEMLKDLNNTKDDNIRLLKQLLGKNEVQ